MSGSKQSKENTLLYIDKFTLKSHEPQLISDFTNGSKRL